MHCGDSRLYFVRQGELLARTRDHSYIEQRQEANPTVPVPGNFNRNVLGHLPGFSHQTGVRHHRAGAAHARRQDVAVSDGLWGSLADPEIVLQLGRQQVGFAVPELVERALAGAYCTATT